MALDVRTLRDSVTIADGAWGTELDKRGVPPGYCREEWNVSHPDAVEAVAAAAGGDGATFALLGGVDDPNERAHSLMRRCQFTVLGEVSGAAHPIVVYERPL